MLADYSQISTQNEAEFSKELTVKYGVTVIPVSAFYRTPYALESNYRLVRFCFAKKDKILDSVDGREANQSVKAVVTSLLALRNRTII